VTVEELSRRLERDTIARLGAAEWEDVRSAFEEAERHKTFLAGDLVIVRDDRGPIAVEEPSSGERVLRRLADEGEVRRFVKERLETYERMWDGCGCTVEYYR
jgi:hypothetical protein